MRQQINLYQPIFSEAKQPLSAATVSMALTAIVSCLIAYSVYTSTRVARLASDVEVQRSRQTQIESELAAATAANDARSNPEEVEARVKQLSASLNERKKELEVGGRWLQTERVDGKQPVLAGDCHVAAAEELREHLVGTTDVEDHCARHILLRVGDQKI